MRGKEGGEMKGMIVYSFAWRTIGHSPCNVRLAEAVMRIVEAEQEEVLIFAQRTTAKILRRFNVECHVVQKQPGYEDSKEVTRQAAELFRQKGIKEVILVAQPFLQLVKCLQLVRKEGFTTWSFWKLVRAIGWIGFDRLSVQPQTRGPIRLVFYTVMQMVFGYKPPPEQSEP